MQKTTVVLLLSLFVLITTAGNAEEAPKKVVDLANSVLAQYGKDTQIVAAVKERNAKAATLAQVQEMDAKWRATAGVVDYMKALMESECGKYLKTIQNSKPYFAEIFVMDQLGANVAMTDKTSDYWQGDEAKFQKSFNQGTGAVFVDEVEFDESTQSYLVQISVPVMEGEKAIGAVTFGIDIEKID